VALNFIIDLEKDGLNYDILCILLPTTPLRTPEDIKEAFKIFFNRNADFLIGITETHPSAFKTFKEERGYLSFLFKDFIGKKVEPPKTYRHNGAIMIASVNEFKKQKTLYGKKLVGYTMPEERSVDIDNYFDLIVADCIIRKQAAK
jgi:CMP-N-acetylneuraminic acid synthetase